jgi:hypothetical protein
MFPKKPAVGDPHLLLFRRCFALIWLVYDVFDWAVDGSMAAFVSEVPLDARRLQQGLFGGLILSQAGIVLGAGATAQVACLLALLLRAFLAACCDPLNDFYYVCVMLVFCCLIETPPRPFLGLDLKAWALLQTAWIYGMTGMLKLSPNWLSGSHLWVRQMHLLHHQRWPYPGWYAGCVESLPCTQRLAWGGVVAELGLAALLAHAALWPPEAFANWRGRRRLTLLLCCGLHGFAALTTNVWFFGLSMAAQVYFLTADRLPTRQIR